MTSTRLLLVCLSRYTRIKLIKTASPSIRPSFKWIPSHASPPIPVLQTYRMPLSAEDARLFDMTRLTAHLQKANSLHLVALFSNSLVVQDLDVDRIEATINAVSAIDSSLPTFDSASLSTENLNFSIPNTLSRWLKNHGENALSMLDRFGRSLFQTEMPPNQNVPTIFGSPQRVGVESDEAGGDDLITCIVQIPDSDELRRSIIGVHGERMAKFASDAGLTRPPHLAFDWMFYLGTHNQLAIFIDHIRVFLETSSNLRAFAPTAERPWIANDTLIVREATSNVLWKVPLLGQDKDVSREVLDAMRSLGFWFKARYGLLNYRVRFDARVEGWHIRFKGNLREVREALDFLTLYIDRSVRKTY